MKLKDKYILSGDKDDKGDKTVLGVEAYAICEMIDELINKLERLRISALLK